MKSGFLVTINDKLYKVCRTCNSSQPHFIYVDNNTHHTVLGCCRCSQVYTELGHATAPEYIAVLKKVIEAANEYAFGVCQEFCVHSKDKPEDCPTVDPRIKAAEDLIEQLTSS